MATAGRGKDSLSSSRLLALMVLEDVLLKQAFSNEALDARLRASDLDARDRAFASAMVYGTLSRVPTIDAFIASASKKKCGDLHPRLLMILRLGLWQMFWSYSVPPSAAVDESVRLGRALLGEWSTAFINAVLRSLARERPSFSKKQSGIALGLGQELFGLFRSWYGETTAVRLGESFHKERDWLAIVPNYLRCDDAQLEDALLRDGVKLLPESLLPGGRRIQLQDRPLDALASFKAGLFFVQDEASQLAAYLAAACGADSVADLCAAPGGKSFHLFSRRRGAGTFVACDLQEERLERMRENADRLGMSRIILMSEDASDPAFPARMTEKDFYPRDGFDLLLLDVPCSGLGLLARKPEIRLRMGYETLKRFPPLQAAILRNAATLLRKGGVMLYSSCTLNPAENQRQIEDFLSSDEGKEFETEPFRELLPERVAEVVDSDPLTAGLFRQGMLLLMPDKWEMDGFFIARLRKRK